jgi:sortase A
VEGDQFLLYTLNEVLTYEVDQIRVVLPTDLSTLGFEEGKDYCTLFTCTPYGINTHRLMVRGHRVETQNEKHILITAEALQIDEITVALVIGLPVLAISFLIVILRPRKKKYTEMRFGV